MLRRPLSGTPLFALRSLAALAVGAILLAYVRWLPRWIDVRTSLSRDAATPGQENLYLALTWAVVVAAIVSVVIATLLGLLIFWGRSRDGLGLLLFASAIGATVVATDFQRYALMQRTDDLAAFQIAAFFVANTLVLPWLFVFPDGRPVPRWSWILIVAHVLWSFVRAVVPATDPPDSPVVVTLLRFGLVASAVLAQIYRYTRAEAVQRHQLRWFLAGAVLATAAYELMILTSFVLQALGRSGSEFVLTEVSSVLVSLTTVVWLLAVTAAIFRQGLLDIELVLNRTLTYAMLTALLAVTFVAADGLAQRIVIRLTGQRSDLVDAAMAIPLVFLFLAIRTRALDVADRFLSGRRVLTMLFLDIVGSTELAVRLGDAHWRETLERFRKVVRSELRRFGGQEIDTAGDSFFATFTGPGGAVRCARAIATAVRSVGLETRAGAHVGEVHVVGREVTGVAVHVTARLMAIAGPGEVVISRALRDLISGSNIDTRDRGDHELKGVPGRWSVYQVVAA